MHLLPRDPHVGFSTGTRAQHHGALDRAGVVQPDRQQKLQCEEIAEVDGVRYAGQRAAAQDATQQFL